ncbi:MAG: hypothetical protein QOG82_889 [Actinomycetota bacterium]|nr:hypothetical protein [Actinomycetota bacterium]
MPTLRLFASAREAAGTARAEIEATTVAELLDKARGQFGERFGRVLDTSRVWVNGQPAEMGTVITGHDIVAVLPPVSGGSSPAEAAARAAPAPAAPSPETPGPATATGPAAPTGPPPESSAPAGAPAPTAAPAPPAATRPGLRPLGGARRPGSHPASGTGDGSERPARRLRLVPPPPPDDPSDTASPDHTPAPPPAPSSSVGGSMGRLALAPVPEPFPPPAAPPIPTPVGQQAAAAAPETAPETAPVPESKPVAPLAVVHQSTRPHGRLGVAWAMVTAGALFAGPGWLSVWLAVIAFVAASQTAIVWRKRGERPLPAFAAATAAALPLTAATGLDHMNMVVAGAIVLTLIARVAAPTKAPGRDVGITLMIGLSIGMAAAAPVLLRSINIPAALYLLACAAIYDAGAYLVGTGASSAWEGPAAGVVALLPLSMAAAVVLVPPFHGGAPLLLGLIAAVLAPFGPVAGSALLGDRTAYAPALRRLDSLLIMGPIWAWCAAALLL